MTTTTEGIALAVETANAQLARLGFGPSWSTGLITGQSPSVGATIAAQLATKYLAEREAHETVRAAWSGAVDREAEALIKLKAAKAELLAAQAKLAAAEACSDRVHAKLAASDAALEPFAAFGLDNVDDSGWAKNGYQGDPIRYWFGPSEFRAAIAASHRPEPEVDPLIAAMSASGWGDNWSADEMKIMAGQLRPELAKRGHGIKPEPKVDVLVEALELAFDQWQPHGVSRARWANDVAEVLREQMPELAKRGVVVPAGGVK